eukprot:3754707-Rhodomonas_salina.2
MAQRPAADGGACAIPHGALSRLEFANEFTSGPSDEIARSIETTRGRLLCLSPSPRTSRLVWAAVYGDLGPPSRPAV